MKAGTVALVGRPNVGKSTLVNSIVGQKVSITSPKPQTTRFPIHAVLEDTRGQMILMDLPGLFRKTKDTLSKKINMHTLSSLEHSFDVLMYVVDHTRTRDFEESRVVGIVRKIKKPKVLVFNKIDVKEPSFMPLYKFLESEFDHVFYVSALSQKHLAPLVQTLFDLLPEKRATETPGQVLPVMNMDSKMFLAELVREKIFLKTRKELPYTTTVVVDEIAHRDNGMTYIKAQITTTHDKYRKMLIGRRGRKIKEIGSMARKELELATNKKIYLDLTVTVDKHWVQTLA